MVYDLNASKMEDVLDAGSCHSGDRHPTNDRPASCRPRSVPGGPLGARARQFHSFAGVNPLQTIWLERGTVISRVALLPRTDEVQPWFGRFVPDRTSVSGRGFRSRAGSGTGRLPEETRPRFAPKCATKNPALVLLPSVSQKIRPAQAPWYRAASGSSTGAPPAPDGSSGRALANAGPVVQGGLRSQHYGPVVQGGLRSQHNGPVVQGGLRSQHNGPVVQGALRSQHYGPVVQGALRFQHYGPVVQGASGPPSSRAPWYRAPLVPDGSSTGAGERATCETPCTTAPHQKRFVFLHVGK